MQRRTPGSADSKTDPHRNRRVDRRWSETVSTPYRRRVLEDVGQQRRRRVVVGGDDAVGAQGAVDLRSLADRDVAAVEHRHALPAEPGPPRGERVSTEGMMTGDASEGPGPGQQTAANAWSPHRGDRERERWRVRTPEVRDLFQLQAGFQALQLVQARATAGHHALTLPPPQVRLLRSRKDPALRQIS